MLTILTEADQNASVQMTLRSSNSKPSKNLQQLVQDAEVRLKKLLELSDQINQILEERELKATEEARSSYET
jgi:hypothetical protein